MRPGRFIGPLVDATLRTHKDAVADITSVLPDRWTVVSDRGALDVSGEAYTDLIARRAVAAAKVRVALHRYLRAPDQAPDHAGAMRTVLAHMNDLKKQLRIEVRMDGKLALQEAYTPGSRTLVVMYNEEHWVLHSAKTWGDQWISARGIRLESVKRDAKSSLMAGSGRVTDISPLPTTKTHSVVEVFTDGGMSVYGATQMAEDGAPESESRLHALPLSEIRLGKIAGFVYTLQSGYDLTARSERSERSSFGARSSFGSTGATQTDVEVQVYDALEKTATAKNAPVNAALGNKHKESVDSLLHRLLAYKLMKQARSRSSLTLQALARHVKDKSEWMSAVLTLKGAAIGFVGEFLDAEAPNVGSLADPDSTKKWRGWLMSWFATAAGHGVPMWLVARKMIEPAWSRGRFALFRLALEKGNEIQNANALLTEIRRIFVSTSNQSAVQKAVDAVVAWVALCNDAKMQAPLRAIVEYECALAAQSNDPPKKDSAAEISLVTLWDELAPSGPASLPKSSLTSLLALYADDGNPEVRANSAAYALLSLMRYDRAADASALPFPGIHKHHRTMQRTDGDKGPAYAGMSVHFASLAVHTRLMILAEVHKAADSASPAESVAGKTSSPSTIALEAWGQLIPTLIQGGWILDERRDILKRATAHKIGSGDSIDLVILVAVEGFARELAESAATGGLYGHGSSAGASTLTAQVYGALKTLLAKSLKEIEADAAAAPAASPLKDINGAIESGILSGIFESSTKRPQGDRCENAKRVRNARRAMGVFQQTTKKEDRLTVFPILYSDIEAYTESSEHGAYTENEKSAYLGDYSQGDWEPGNAPCFPQPIEITANSTIGEVKACCCVDVRDPKGSNAKRYPKDPKSAKALAEWILEKSNKADVEKATDCAFLRYFTKGIAASKQPGDKNAGQVPQSVSMTEIFRVCGGLWSVDDFLILTMVTSDLPKFAHASDVDYVHKQVLYGALRSVDRGVDDTEKDGSVILTEKSTIREIQRYVATILETRVITETDINQIKDAYRFYLGVKGRTRREIQDAFGPSYKRPWDRIRRWRAEHKEGNTSTTFGGAAGIIARATAAARDVAAQANDALNAGMARAGAALVAAGVPRSWKSALPFAGSHVGLSVGEKLESYKLLGVHQKLDHEYVRRMFGFVGLCDMHVAAVGADKESIDVTLMSLDIGLSKEAEKLVIAVKASASATSGSSALTAKAVERAVRCGFLEWEEGIAYFLILWARGDGALVTRLTAWNDIVLAKRNVSDDAVRIWHVSEAASKAKGVAGLVAVRLLWLVGGGMVPALSGLIAKGVGADGEVLAQLAGSLGEFASASGVFAQASVYAPLAQITRLAHAAIDDPVEEAKWAAAAAAAAAVAAAAAAAAAAPAPAAALPGAPAGIALAAAAADKQRATVAVIAAFIVLYDMIIISPSGSAGSTANAIAEQVCALVPGLGPDVADMLELFATFSEGNVIAAGLRKAGAFADFVVSESPLASVGGGSDAERLATAMSVVGALRSAGAANESEIHRMVRVMSLVSIVSGAQGLKWHTRMRIRADGIRQMAETMALSANVAASLDAGAPRPGDGAEIELDRYAASIRMRDALGLLTALKKNQLFVSESHVYRATAESNRVVSAVDELIPGGYVPHDQLRDMDVFATSNQGVVASVIGNMTSWRGNVTGACLVVVTGGDARVLRDRLMRGTENGLPWVRVPGEAMDSVRVAGGSRRKERMRARSVLLVSAKGHVPHTSRAQALTGPTAVLIVDHDLASWIVLAIDVAGAFAETSASIGNFAIAPNTERAFTQRVHMIMSNKEPKQCGHHETRRVLGALTPAQKAARRVLDVECIKSAMLVEYRLILETVRTLGFASEPRKADFELVTQSGQNAQTRFMFWEAVAKAIATAAVDAMVSRRIAKLGQGQWKDEMGPSIEAIRDARRELDALTDPVTAGMQDAEKRQIARDASVLVIIDGQTDTSLEIGPAPVGAPVARAAPRWTVDMATTNLTQEQRARIEGKFAR